MSSPGNALDELLSRFQNPDVPQVSVAVADGAGTYTAAWGCGTQTLFQAASVSKAVAALTAMVLVDEKKLGLDDDINTRLTSWHLPADVTQQAQVPVTLRNVLCHSAALSVAAFAGYPHDAPVPALAQILDGLPPSNNCPVRRKGLPGVEERYSGGGYVILQQLLEDVTHLSLPELVDQKVFTPLGMCTATYTAPQVAVAKGRAGGQEIPGGWRRYPELAASGLWCTPADLLAFAQGLQACIAGTGNPVIKDRATALAMIRKQVPPSRWGLGVELGGLGPSRFLEHEGQNEGYACHLQATTAGGKAVVVMTASDQGGQVIHLLLPALRRLVAWPDEASWEPEGTPGDPPASFSNQAALDAAYAGNYQLLGGASKAGPGGQVASMVSVAGQGTRWSLTMPGPRTELMEPVSASEAVSPTRDLAITFHLNDGMALGLTLAEGDSSQDFARMW